MHNFKQTFFVFISIIIAWMLMIVHLPHQWQWLRPEWLSLVLIYWVFTRPHIVGVGIGWIAGFGLDIFGDGLLGSHALAMAIVVYLTHQLRNRVRLFPFWQQAFVVLVLVGLGQLTLLAIQWLIGQPPRTAWYWASCLTSVILWPWFYRFLGYYDRRTNY